MPKKGKGKKLSKAQLEEQARLAEEERIRAEEERLRLEVRAWRLCPDLCPPFCTCRLPSTLSAP